MNTKILLSSIENDIKDAAQIIRDGGLVAFPTETVYGLGGDGLNPEASKKIYSAKGRPSDNPLIIHICCMEDLEKIVRDMPEYARKLANKFWPGPLTMVFNKKDCVPLETTGGLDTVAVRMPSNKIASEFIRYAGGYVAAPSANLSGRPSPTTFAHVFEDMNGRIDMIIDGGLSDIGLESTIVDATGDVPMILRPGYINGDMVKECVGDVAYDPAVFGTDNVKVKPKAPGMRYRHYAPKGELIIVCGNQTQVSDFILKEIDKERMNGKRCAVIASKETAPEYVKADCMFEIGSREDEESIARHLYDTLRECDTEKIDCIYSEEFNTPVMGQAIMNRLIKAAGHRIVNV